MRYVVVSLLIFILSFTNIFKPIQNGFGFVVAPIQFGLSRTAINIKNFVNFFAGLKDLRRENIRLLENRLALESSIAGLKYLEEENALLKKQLQINDDNGLRDKLLLVSAMGDPLDLTSSFLYIDKGVGDGVKIDDNVILGNYIVGIVKEVYAGKSLVELITSSKMSVSVYDIDSQNKPEGVALGCHGSSVEVEKLLPGENIKVGDVFVTSGKDGKFVPGMIVGKVSSIRFEPSDTLKTAVLQTVMDTYKLNKLFVITSR